jgi:hypothetical protein
MVDFCENWVWGKNSRIMVEFGENSVRSKNVKIKVNFSEKLALGNSACGYQIQKIYIFKFN